MLWNSESVYFWCLPCKAAWCYYQGSRYLLENTLGNEFGQTVLIRPNNWNRDKILTHNRLTHILQTENQKAVLWSTVYPQCLVVKWRKDCIFWFSQLSLRRLWLYKHKWMKTLLALSPILSSSLSPSLSSSIYSSIFLSLLCFFLCLYVCLSLSFYLSISSSLWSELNINLKCLFVCHQKWNILRQNFFFNSFSSTLHLGLKMTDFLEKNSSYRTSRCV